MELAHHPLVDQEVNSFITDTIKSSNWNDIKKFEYKQFEDTYRKWLEDSSKCVIDLHEFKYTTFIFGTLAGIDGFIQRHHNKTIRVSNDDFVVTKVLCKNNNINFEPLENGPIKKYDAVIMSHPFSGNGTTMPECIDVLQQCEELGVPVLLDCAYFGIGYDMTYPLQFKCITDLVFSTSKHFATTQMRLGIRFTRNEIDDAMSFGQLSADIYNKQGAYIVTRINEKFTHDWFVDKWRPISEKIAKELDLVDTNCITLKTTKRPMPEFKRGSYTRVCISQELTAKN